MRAADIIEKVKRGIPLEYKELEYFINGVTDRTIPDYQTAAFLMACWFRPLCRENIFAMTKLMANSGDVADLSGIDGIKADKHSTGGVGDKTTLIVTPMVAAADMGIYMAKMSGRGLGFTGGTIDKLESIPGISMAPPMDKFIGIIKETGFCISGQSGNFAPADKYLYALRDVTGTVDSLPLIASSVMSKKLAAGSDVIILDVKCGSGAFMKDYDSACELAELMIDIGKSAGKKTAAVISGMDAPLGYNIGNSLEVIEAVEVLQGNKKGALYDLSLLLSALVLSVSTGVALDECKGRAEESLKNGRALDKLAETVGKLGGDKKYIYDTSLFKKAGYILEVKSEKSGFISGIDAGAAGHACLVLGAGREVKEDVIDASAGIEFKKTVGAKVEKGETIALLHTGNENMARLAFSEIIKAVEITENKPKTKNIIYKIMGEINEA